MTSPTVVACPSCGRRNRVPAAAAGTPRCGQCHTALPWIVDAGDQDFAGIAERAPLPVLLDLWAPWCGPCRMVSPALEDLARSFAGRIKLVKVDVDAAPRVAQRFGVRAVPTLLVLHHGQVVERQAGAVPAPALRSWLENALSSITARR
ncbi:thioredoxin [Geodermatophilus sp. SYSU D00779]